MKNDEIFASNPMKSDETPVIPYKIVRDSDLPDEWHQIHDFLRGFGFRRREKTVFWWDAHRYLKIDISQPGVDLDEVYQKLEAPLAEALEKRIQWHKDHPFNLTKFTIPKVNRVYPKL